MNINIPYGVDYGDPESDPFPLDMESALPYIPVIQKNIS